MHLEHHRRPLGTKPLGKERTRNATGNPTKGLHLEVEHTPNEVIGVDVGHLLAIKVGNQA
jgi:hypothetical protein